jgi:hypothetical protein
MTSQARTLTLFDYAADYQWIRLLGWTDDELRRVPVHEQATAGDEMINLANFGGTPLGVSANAGGGTSAEARSIRNLWVYKSTTPPELWARLRELADRGGPSGYNASGEFGEVGQADFPPVAPAEESGMPGGGRGRRDEPGRTGVYPMSSMEEASTQATVHGQMEWGQGERGAEGYHDHGESEAVTVPAGTDRSHGAEGHPGPLAKSE